jgi:hypothetical protein
MKRLLMVVTLVCALSVPALAGEVPTGGFMPPQTVPGEVPTGGSPQQIAQDCLGTIVAVIFSGFAR